MHPEVLARIPNAHFVFAGDGPQTDNLKARIAADGLEGRIHLLGLRRDVTNVLASLDVFYRRRIQGSARHRLHRGRRDGPAGRGVQRRWRAEVISTARPAIWCRRTMARRLIEPISRLLADPVLRQSMGANATEFVRRKFAREVMAQGMEQLVPALAGGAMSLGVPLPVLMYHHISPKPGLVTCSPDNFRAHMQWLVENGWKTLSTDRFHADSGNRRGAEKSVLVTFDDGYLDNWVHAHPVLKEFGQRATLFPDHRLDGRGAVRPHAGQPACRVRADHGRGDGRCRRRQAR